MRDGARPRLRVRAGVHTGEMEPGREVRGIAVHTGARVAALAGPGEILVSRTIRDLVAGAPIRLESRGVHQFKGVPGLWEVFAVISLRESPLAAVRLLVRDGGADHRDDVHEGVQAGVVGRVGSEQGQPFSDSGRRDHQVSDPPTRLAAHGDDRR